MADAMLAGAAQGAAAGASFGPWGAAIGAVGGAILGASSNAQPSGGAGSAPAPGGASAAARATYGSSNLNGDNWSVNFGGSQTNSPVNDKTFSATGPTAAATAQTAGPGGYLGLPVAAGGSPGGVPGWVLIVAGGALLWKLLSRH